VDDTDSHTRWRRHAQNVVVHPASRVPNCKRERSVLSAVARHSHLRALHACVPVAARREACTHALPLPLAARQPVNHVDSNLTRPHTTKVAIEQLVSDTSVTYFTSAEASLAIHLSAHLAHVFHLAHVLQRQASLLFCGSNEFTRSRAPCVIDTCHRGLSEQRRS
jgi:hypothetical protein